MVKFIGQVGLGYWGKNILRNLYELGVLHAACDFDVNLITQFKQLYKNVIFDNDFDKLLNDPEIRAVVISTPATTHYEMVKRSLLADKDVFVEKPLALRFAEGQELVKLAEERNKILMVGHILQYHPAIKKLKELIFSGALGRIHYIYSNRLNIGKLRIEENILWSFAPHDISVILSIMEEMPEKVFAVGGDYVTRGIFDTTVTILEFKNGVKAHIFVSWLHPYKEQKLIVVGSKAMAVFDDVSSEKLFVYPHGITWKEGKIPIAEKAEYKIIEVEKHEPLRLELSHFIQCVVNRSKPMTDGQEGLRVLKVLEVAEESLRSNLVIDVAKPIKFFVHPTAIIDDGVEIGENTKIWHFSHVLSRSKIGKNCIIGQNVVIGPDVSIGDRCKVQNNVSVYKGVTLEEEVFCGPSCVFTNVYNPRAFIERKHEFKKTLVKKGATIGANATVLCGVTIGRYAMVGAGALVRQDVPDYALVVGVPARQIGWVCKCGTTLIFEGEIALCNYCSSQYRLNNGTLESILEV